MFKVGDYLTGTKRNCYGYTNSDAIVKITDVFGYNEIRVTLIRSKKNHTVEGMSFCVDSTKFKKIPKVKLVLELL